MSKEYARGDAKTFREMSVPHDSTEKVQEAIDGFMSDLLEARKRWRIKNVRVACECAVVVPVNERSTTEGSVLFTGGFGDPAAAMGLLSAAVWQEIKRRGQRISGDEAEESIAEATP